MGYGWVLCRVGECAGSLGGLYGSGWGCNPKLPTLKFLIPEIPTPDIPITNFPLLKFPPQNSHPKNSHPQNSHPQTRPLPPAQLSQGSLGRITPAPKSLPVLSRAQKPTVTPPAPIPLPTGPAASPRQSIPGTRRDAGDARPWVGQPLDAAIFNAPWGGTAPYPPFNPWVQVPRFHPRKGPPFGIRGAKPLATCVSGCVGNAKQKVAGRLLPCHGYLQRRFVFSRAFFGRAHHHREWGGGDGREQGWGGWLGAKPHRGPVASPCAYVRAVVGMVLGESSLFFPGEG